MGSDDEDDSEEEDLKSLMAKAKAKKAAP